MVTEQDYLNAQKIVDEWLKTQPVDSKYPYKPKLMSAEDYSRQRALNEILRLFERQETISFDDFGEILDHFDLSIFNALNSKNEHVIFIQRLIEEAPFTGEKIKSSYKQRKEFINPLNDNKIDSLGD